MCWEVSRMPKQRPGPLAWNEATKFKIKLAEPTQVTCDMWQVPIITDQSDQWSRHISPPRCFKSKLALSRAVANRSRFGSVPRIEVLNLQLATWMNLLFFSSFETPPTHAFKFPLQIDRRIRNNLSSHGEIWFYSSPWFRFQKQYYPTG